MAVFARVTPAQKLRIVQALQLRGEVVAMTGDGVNDGPALRAADIGVTMGERGNDVAREAASLVLLDDRFGSLVDAVRGGGRMLVGLLLWLILLLQPLATAFGLPPQLDARWVLAVLAVPAVWSLWRVARG